MATTVAHPRASALRELHFRLGEHLPAWLLTALIAALVAIPLGMLLLGSLSHARIPSDFSLTQLTLANYVDAYTNPLTYRVFGNTLIYVGASVGIGIALAFSFAWLAARTDMPAKWLAYVGITLPMVIPGMLESIVWVLLFSPRIGFVNRAATGVLGFEEAPFNVYSIHGMIALESLSVVPTSFLMFLPLLLRLDPSVEEAAATCGGRAATVLRRITLPLLLPGIISIVVYQTVSVLSSFEVPGIIGLPGQVYVFSTLIYTYTSATASAGGSAYGAAAALALVYLIINVAGLALYARVTGNAARFAVVSGRAYRPRVIQLGPWRWAALAAVVAFLLLTVVMPILVLLWTSFTPFILQPGAEALGRLTDRNWRELLSNAALLQTIGNTVVVTAVTATLAVVLSLLVSWVTVRTRFPAKGLLDQLAFVSHGLPGIILALALVWLWVQVDIVPIYGTVWIIVLGFVTGFLAYGTRMMSASLLQVHAELEDAAYASGASPLVTVRRVFLPLLAPALAVLWIWVAMHAVRFVTLPLMLQTGPQNTLFSVYLWRQWEIGEVNLVAAAGSALVFVMLLVTFLVGRFGLAPRQTNLGT